MFVLINTFTNDSIISRHRTVRAATLALHRVSRSLPDGSYLPMAIRHDNGDSLSGAEYDEMCDVDPYNR
jgi:hypothetical protein